MEPLAPVSLRTVELINQALSCSYEVGDILAFPSCLPSRNHLSAGSLKSKLPEEARDLPLVVLPHSKADTVDVVRVVYLKKALEPLAVVIF
jgi:hypothetical protein